MKESKVYRNNVTFQHIEINAFVIQGPHGAANFGEEGEHFGETFICADMLRLQNRE